MPNISLSTYNQVQFEQQGLNYSEITINGSDIKLDSEESILNMLSVIIDGHGKDFEDLVQLYYQGKETAGDFVYDIEEKIKEVNCLVDNVLSGSSKTVPDLKSRLNQMSAFAISELKQALKELEN